MNVTRQPDTDRSRRREAAIACRDRRRHRRPCQRTRTGGARRRRAAARARRRSPAASCARWRSAAPRWMPARPSSRCAGCSTNCSTRPATSLPTTWRCSRSTCSPAMPGATTSASICYADRAQFGRCDRRFAGAAGGARLPRILRARHSASTHAGAAVPARLAAIPLSLAARVGLRGLPDLMRISPFDDAVERARPLLRTTRACASCSDGTPPTAAHRPSLRPPP